MAGPVDLQVSGGEPSGEFLVTILFLVIVVFVVCFIINLLAKAEEKFDISGKVEKTKKKITGEKKKENPEPDLNLPENQTGYKEVRTHYQTKDEKIEFQKRYKGDLREFGFRHSSIREEYKKLIIFNSEFEDELKNFNHTGFIVDLKGQTFEGEIKNGLIQGEGVLITRGNSDAWCNYCWTKYVGSFKDGLFHGKGTIITLESRGISKGIFLKEKYHFPVGSVKYEGNWKDGQEHGEGVWSGVDGTMKGLWSNGHFIED